MKHLRNNPLLAHIRGAAKRVALVSYARLLRPLPRVWLGLTNNQRIIVLTYHRVNDDIRDSVTVGIEQFDRQMELVSREYPMVRIEDVVKGQIPENSSRPQIAITFDDGYLDNYENAVPILRRHGVPAAFFVSTGYIGTDNGFPHDTRRLGRTLPNMTWDQLRHMRAMDFTIGSHTVSHINCARTEPVLIRKELMESKETIERELGLSEVIFAYPFGGKNDITPQVVEIVRDTGYIGCLSAYGGYNRRGVDPYYVKRVGIDYKFDITGFRACLEGYQLRGWNR